MADIKKKQYPITKSILARKFIFFIFLFSSIVTLIGTSLQLYLDYSKDRTNIQITLDQIETTHLQSIVNNLWLSDNDLINVQLQGILSLPDVQYVAILSDGKGKISVGTRKSSNTLSQKYPLTFSYRDQKVNLGSLQIEATMDNAIQRLRSRVIVILLTQGIKTFLVSLFIFFLFYLLVGRHLRIMADFASRLDLTTIATSIQLDLAKKGSPDELDQVVSSLNDMQVRIRDDIERREQTEEALRQYKHIVSSSTDMLALIDKQFTYLGANKSYLEAFNLTPEQLIGNTVTTVFGKDRFDTIIKPYAERCLSGEEINFQDWIELPAYGRRYIDITYYPYFSEENKVIGFAVSGRNITDRKQVEDNLAESESKYRSLVENLDIGIALVDRNHNIIMANSAVGRIFDKPVEEFVGKKCYFEFEKREHACAHCPGTMAMQSGIQQIIETQGVKADGSVFDLILRALPIFGKDSQLTGFIEIIEDITEQKKGQEEKKNLESRLSQAQKMEAIGTLAGGIAHDFNNILGIILGYAEMAKEVAVPGTDQEKDLENVLAGAERAKGLVQQILTFSRQSQVDPAPIEIQPLIKEGLKMLRSSIPTTISITEDIAPQSGVILADPTQIHQILMNLGTNAYHAMEGTGGVLSVTLKSTFIGPDEKELLLHVKSGEYVEFTLSDTGTGMGPDVIEKIFDPYFTTKEIGKGTGMGLAIIHGIVKEYGGTITVESQVGKGTTFHVYLPVVEEGALPEKEEPKDIPRGTERILFIDDEQLLAEMGKVLLERLGYHVTVRRSSLEALETFQNTPNSFDLVITDQTMHGMTGYDLSRRMMQIKPDIPIILCTGYSSLIDENSAKSIGIKEFALKPLTKEVIAKLIRKVLGEAV